MRNTNVVAVFLVLLKDNQILLSQRKNTGYHDGEYSVVAGHVEAGETFTQAVRREAKEEVGLILKLKKLAVAHVQHRKSEADQSERVDVYFVAREWRGEIKNQEPHKCSQLKWFDLKKLPDNMVPCVRAAIGNIIKQQTYSEFGWQK